MDERDTTTAGDDTRESERAIAPVEPDEDGEIEEVEGEEDGESEAEHLQDHTHLEAARELSELQIAADEESRQLGLTEFDGAEFRQALIESGAEGLELAEEDKPLFSSFFAAQREAGASSAEIGRAVGWYLRQNAGAAEQRHETDLADAGRIQDRLKAEWARDYEANIARSKQFLESVPEIADAITTARLPDGSLLLHQEGFPDFLLGLAKGRSMPAQKEAPVASTPKERLAQIEEVLRADSQKYFREKLDEEAIQLRRQIEKTTPRSAGPGVAHLESQLSTLKKIMATDPNRYWKENMSQRAIEIRRQIEQVEAANAAKGR